MRDPPALPGRHAEFDSSGIGMGKLPHVSRYASRKGSPHDELSQSKSLEVGMSVSRGLHPEVSEEGDLRVAAQASRSGYCGSWPGSGRSEVEEGHLLADHVHMLVSIPPKYSVAQVIGYIEGEERDPHRPRVCRAPRAALSGSTSGLAGYFVLYAGSGRASDSRVYPGAGTGRPSARASSIG